MSTRQHRSNDDRKPAGYASGPLHDNRGGNALPSRALALRRGLAAAAVALGTLAACGGGAAHAQVRAEGRPDVVHLEVSGAPLGDVLEVLQTKFNLRYRTSDALDQPVTGTFNGPLQRITARLLEGYDFAMKVTPEGVDVLVLGQSGGKSAVPATPPAKPHLRVMTAQEANRRERENAR